MYTQTDQEHHDPWSEKRDDPFPYPHADLAAMDVTVFTSTARWIEWLPKYGAHPAVSHYISLPLSIPACLFPNTYKVWGSSHKFNSVKTDSLQGPGSSYHVVYKSRRPHKPCKRDNERETDC